MADASVLRSERDKANKEVQKLVSKKREVVTALKELSSNIKELKEKRTQANKAVQDAKKSRDSLRTDLTEVSKELEGAKEQLPKGYSKRDVERELERVRGEYQKGYVPPQREERIVQEMEFLEQLLDSLEGVEEARAKLGEKGLNLKDLRTGVKAHQQVLLSSVKESNEYHEGLVKAYEEIKELRSELNALDSKIDEAKKRANDLHADFIKAAESERGERKNEFSNELKPKKPRQADEEKSLNDLLEKAKKGEKVDLTPLLLAKKLK